MTVNAEHIAHRLAYAEDLGMRAAISDREFSLKLDNWAFKVEKWLERGIKPTGGELISLLDELKHAREAMRARLGLDRPVGYGGPIVDDAS